jgi:pimeloyl-ACP methyl ester carboxylesterase
MKFTRTGSGPPLILVHGLGNSAQAWNPVVPGLAARRELILVTLPGHDGDPVSPELGTFAGLMRSFDDFIAAEGWAEVPLVGSSLGGRMVLEMARRGHRGAVVALDPGGFWQGWERTFLRTSLQAMLGLVRMLGKGVKPLARTAAIRSAFPGSTLHWFEHSGHFPMWDEPDETLKLILRATATRGRRGPG